LLFTFESVVPPPVDRQAVPPAFVSLSTRVPVANRLLGLPTCAVNVASVPDPIRAIAPSATAPLIATFFHVFMYRSVPASPPSGIASPLRPRGQVSRALSSIGADAGRLNT